MSQTLALEDGLFGNFSILKYHVQFRSGLGISGWEKAQKNIGVPFGWIFFVIAESQLEKIFEKWRISHVLFYFANKPMLITDGRTG